MHKPVRVPPALERACRYLRLPGSPDTEPDCVSDDSEGALRCRETGRVFRFDGGVLDLLGANFLATDTQKMLDTWFTAWAYDRLRARFAPAIGMPTFADEVANVEQRLSLAPGDVVLDIACGQGIFTVELAKRVGAEGLVIGIDIAGSMLRRAVHHVLEADLDNVLLVRGDALALPVASASLSKVNCSGGLHQFPDLRRALREMARVSRPGARVAVSGFARSGDDRYVRFKRWAKRRFETHFVPESLLIEELQRAGYCHVESRMEGRWVGYAWGSTPPDESRRPNL